MSRALYLAAVFGWAAAAGLATGAPWALVLYCAVAAGVFEVLVELLRSPA